MGRDGVEPLLRALPGASVKLAWEIINLLAKFRDPRAVLAVADFLHAENGALRVAAAQTLGLIGHRSATMLLLRAMDDNQQSGAIVWIVQALGRIGDPRATDPLISLMQETDFARRAPHGHRGGGASSGRAPRTSSRRTSTIPPHHVRARARRAGTPARAPVPGTLSLSGT